MIFFVQCLKHLKEKLKFHFNDYKKILKINWDKVNESELYLLFHNYNMRKYTRTFCNLSFKRDQLS